MTVTPAVLASCSMCAPVPESSGQMISTVAPWAMADCAMLTWGASLPSAFCTVRSEDGSPAAANAAFRYGASNSTQRVDDVVSGRMTATLPLPRDASGASAFSALNEGSMSLTVRCGSVPELAALAAGFVAAGAELGLGLALERQAATSSAALRHAAVRPALFMWPALFMRDRSSLFTFPRLAGTAGAAPARRSNLVRPSVTGWARRPPRGGPAIARALPGNDQRPAAGRLELGAQPADVHADVLGLGLVPVTPHTSQQMSTGQQLAPVDRQLAQQRELRRRQVHLRAAQPHLLVRQVDRQVAHRDDGRRRPGQGS